VYKQSRSSLTSVWQRSEKAATGALWTERPHLHCMKARVPRLGGSRWLLVCFHFSKPSHFSQSGEWMPMGNPVGPFDRNISTFRVCSRAR
jgi:hypothetical protein